MTLATKITVLRLILVPVFVYFAISYGESWEASAPDETLRWLAVGTFILAAATDGIDGWIARHFRQKSKLGAFLDPLTDKALLLTGLITLTLVDWGDDWHLPVWFIILVILRDAVILGGIVTLYIINRTVPIKPHWTGKVCTVTQMVALGWVMLKLFDLSPTYPTVLAAVFTLWSGVVYFLEGLSQLPKSNESS